MDRMIFVENLHPEADVSNLCSKFKSFGRILTASIDFDEHFISTCKGHVLFENPISAKGALAEMNGVKIMGKPLVIKRAPKKSKSGSASERYTKIFVKNFDLNWDECDFTKAFKKFGEIVESQISQTEGKSNGYGFIKFKDHTAAKKAVEEMNDEVMGEKVLKVEPYLPKSIREDLQANSLNYAKNLLEQSTQRNNLHVKNLPKNIDECELRKLFEVFGPVTSVKVAKNEFKASKGFGFVAFKAEKDAETALFRMNGYSLNSHILEVNFKQNKEQRQHYFELLKGEDSCEKKIGKSSVKPLHPKSTALNSKAPEVLYSFRCKR